MLAFGRDLALAAAEPRLVRRLPGRLLVHRAAVPGRAVVAGPRSDRAQRAGACRPGGGGAQRHRRDLLPARRGGDCAERRADGAATEDAGGGASATGLRSLAGRRPRGRPRRRDQAQLPPARRRARRSGWSLIAPRGGARGALWRPPASRALAGGGYWYLRNLVHTGNPLPWVDDLGPISLPAPDQALGGREAHSVLGYLTDGAVWSDWLLPGLHDGLWFVWPLLLAALAGLVLAWPRCSAVVPSRRRRKEPRAGCGDPVLPLAGLGRPRRPPSPGSSPRPPPPAPRACPAASSPASATSPRPSSSASPCCRPRRSCAPLRPRLRDAVVVCPHRRYQSDAVIRADCGAVAARGWRWRWSLLAVAARLPGPAPLPGEPLRGPLASPPRASTPPSPGPATLRRPHRHHQHPPVPPLRHRPLQPRRVRRRRAPPRRLRGPSHLPQPGASCSTRATTTTSSPPATASNPASPHTHRRHAGPKAPEPSPSSRSRRRSSSS